MDRIVIQHLGVLNQKKWPIEENIVSWNGGQAKLDIRPWEPGDIDDDTRKCGKGISLTNEEAKALQEIIADYLYE